MIISASYKTDIPTFYGEWFINRLEAGYCKMVNPYNQQVSRVDLTPKNVDGFVFWTKNIGPFLSHLQEVHRKGYPFIVQHTLNNYPRELELKVTDSLHAIKNMRRLSDEYGSGVVVWRYDPIVVSSLTPLDWHRCNFAHLARNLQGVTDEVVISFAQIYKKTQRNMDKAAEEFAFTWHEHTLLSSEDVKFFILEMAAIAQSYGMQLRICSQKALLIPGIAEEARCVDADRLEKVAHKPIDGKAKQKGNRKECGCFVSKDIGEYDTCPHGCIYCYAVQNRDVALQRYKNHDPKSEFLFPPRNSISSNDKEVVPSQIITVGSIQKRMKEELATQEKLFE